LKDAFESGNTTAKNIIESYAKAEFSQNFQTYLKKSK
jgi:aconitase B